MSAGGNKASRLRCASAPLSPPPGVRGRGEESGRSCAPGAAGALPAVPVTAAARSGVGGCRAGGWRRDAAPGTGGDGVNRGPAMGGGETSNPRAPPEEGRRAQPLSSARPRR